MQKGRVDAGPWPVVTGRRVIARVGQLELLDRAYTMAAQSFVTLIPLILALAAALSSSSATNVVAQELIERFGLIGAAARSVQDLFAIRAHGTYWLGLVLTVYAAFTLGKRASRAYNAIWGTDQLPLRAQWRALAWIGMQVAMMLGVSELRRVARDSGPVLALAGAALILVVWMAVEFLTQSLVTAGQVARSRMLLAVTFATLGRLGILVWSAVFLTASISRQAEAYGPIGVVFALFTGLLGYWIVLLGATLLAAVLTEPERDRPDGTAAAGVGSAPGSF